MTRSRWLNIVAVGLIILIVGTFAAIAIPGASQQNDATPSADAATPTPPPTLTPLGDTEPEPIQAPVQVGNITLTADLTDAEALASAVPLNSMGAFSVPTPMYGGPTYIMSVDEARVALGTDPLLPTYVPQTHIMSQWYGYDGLISIAYTTDAYEHSLVLNEQRPTANAQTYAVGETQLYGTAVHGNYAVYLEQAPLGWIPPLLSGFDPTQGGWMQATANAPSGGTVWPFNALIWEENGLMMRLMSTSLSIDELLAIAESMTSNGFAIPTTPDGTPTPTPLPTPNLNAYYIPEVPISVTLPPNYSMTQNTEPNRRGSYASYDLAWTGDRLYPSLYEIQFFSYDSIEKFTENCSEDSFCFEGDYPTLERFNDQIEALTNGTEIEGYQMMMLGMHNYFVSNIPCSGNSCIIREYTTFLAPTNFGDTKVDVWVMMESEDQALAADGLMQQVYFEQMQPTPAPTPTVQTVSLGDTITTAPRQQINIVGQDLALMVTFINDSRCAPNVECVQAGSVTINVHVSHQGVLYTATLTLEAGGEPVSTIVDGYEITLIAVETLRDPPDGPPTGYIITLMVDQAITN